jgi:hypothetical protein
MERRDVDIERGSVEIEDLGELIGMRIIVKEYEALKRNIFQRMEELEE